MSSKRFVTITRQYGSGGHDIGKALAKALGIGFYDKELISLAAKESGIAPEVFEKADEYALRYDPAQGFVVEFCGVP